MNTRRTFALLAAVAAAGCGRQLTGSTPSLSGVQPAAVCNAQLTTVVTVTGDKLTPVTTESLTQSPHLNLPQLSLVLSKNLSGGAAAGDASNCRDAAPDPARCIPIPDDATDPASSHVRWVSQQSMSFDVFPALNVPPGFYGVHVDNNPPSCSPATCPPRSADFADSLLVVPPPTLSLAAPDIICGDQDNDVVLTGDFFLQSANGDLPTVTIGTKTYSGAAVTTDAASCRALPGSSGLKACTKLSVHVARSDFGPTPLAGPPLRIVVTNRPIAVGCSSTSDSVTLTVVPKPTVASAVPDLACTSLSQRVTVTGTGFITVDGVAPTVTLLGMPSVSLSAMASNCTPVVGPTEMVQSCTTLDITVPTGSTAGAYTVRVTNPAPIACASTEVVTFTILPQPTVTSAAPDLACTTLSQTVTVTGTGFITVNGMTPTVTLAGMSNVSLSSVVSNCMPVVGPTETVQSCTTLTISVPNGSTAGGYTVRVTNPAPVACASTEAVTFTVLPDPTVTLVTPSLVCTASGAQMFTVTGASFITVNGSAPAVNLVGVTTTPLAAIASNCTSVAGPVETVQTCTTLTVTAPQGTMAGTYNITVTNPTPVGCTSTQMVPLTVLVPPMLTSLTPDIASAAADPVTMTLAGSGFVRVGTMPCTAMTCPTINIGTLALTAQTATGCTAIPGSATAQSCTGLTVTIPMGTTPGLAQVTVINPTVGLSGCASAARPAFLPPPPAVTALMPPGFCNSSTTQSVQVNGSHFVAFPAAMAAGQPTLTVGTKQYTASNSDLATGNCTALPGLSQAVQDCTTLTVTVAPADLTACPASGCGVIVTAPPPVSAISSGGPSFAVTQPPTITAVAPNKLCPAGGTLTINGTNLTSSMSVQLLQGTTVVATASMVTVNAAATQATATFGSVPRSPASSPYTLRVTTGGGGCSATRTSSVAVTTPIVFFVDPPVVFNGLATQVTIFASGFGATPNVMITRNGTADPPVAVTGISVPSANRITFTLPITNPPRAVGGYDVSVADPITAACPATLSEAFRVVNQTPLVITGIDPPFGYNAATTPVTVTAAASTTLPAASTTSGYSYQLYASGGTGPYTWAVATGSMLPPGLMLSAGGILSGTPTAAGTSSFTLQVNDSSMPAQTASATFTLTVGAAPPAALTISTLALPDAVIGVPYNGAGVAMQVSGGTAPFTWTVTAGALPVGFALSAAGALFHAGTPTQAGVFTFVATVSDSTMPTANSASVSLVLTVRSAAGPLVVTTLGGGMKPLPRLYLNSASLMAAISLTDVAFVSSSTRCIGGAPGALCTSASAAVPPGAPVGTYDLVVVNPDGAVGVLPAAFSVVANPIPFIDSVSPSALIVGAAPVAFGARGGNFRAACAAAGPTCPTLTFTCVSCGATGCTPVTPAPQATVNSATSAVISATLNMNGVANNLACVVRVTNNDGTYAEFSSVVTNNPAQKITNAFVAGPNMRLARRALVAQGGFVSRSAQFLYTLGGDNGNPMAAADWFDSVETVPLDAFGNTAGSAFFDQRYHLSAPRAFAAGQRVGRWLYMAGGRKGPSTASPSPDVLASVDRAYLLNPADKVKVTDVAFTPCFEDCPATTLSPGLYYYRVAATVGPTDAFNPSGENLPSDPFGIVVPTLGSGGVSLTLHWSKQAGSPGPTAVTYRVYRTVNPNDPAGTEKRLASVPQPAGTSVDVTFTDDGSMAPAGVCPADCPLPIGSTGVWQVAGTMPSGLEGASAVVAADPTLASQSYLYVLGGKNAAGATANRHVVIPLAATAAAAADGSMSNETQTVGVIANGALTFTGASRWLLGGYNANPINSPALAGCTGSPAACQYIYAAGGNSGAATVGDVDVALVGTGGVLCAPSATLGTCGAGTTWTADRGIPGGLEGFGQAVASSILYTLGGGPLPSDFLRGGGLTGAVPPTSIANWNNAVARLTVGCTGAPGSCVPRYLPGSALQSAFIYVAGGLTAVAPNVATNTLEQVIW